MNCLLIGYGEIGKAVREVYSKYHDIEIIDPQYQFELTCGKYDILLVAIPYSQDFISIVRRYQQDFKCPAVIVFSTVQVGTCLHFNNGVHSPIEGKHPDLADSIRTMQRIMGGYNRIAYKFFMDARQSPVIYPTPEITEALKLLSTTFYGVCLEYYRYAAAVLQELGGEGKEFKQFNAMYNNLYANMGMQQFVRPILDFPKGELGGHCVVPNAKILMEMYPFSMVEEVAEQKENQK
jgi:hypothetical protein